MGIFVHLRDEETVQEAGDPAYSHSSMDLSNHSCVHEKRLEEVRDSAPSYSDF